MRWSLTRSIHAGCVLLLVAHQTAAAPPRPSRDDPQGDRSPLHLQAAPAGELVEIPGGREKAELLQFDLSLADDLLAAQPEETLVIADWPVAPGERADVALTRHDVYAPDAEIWEVAKDGTRHRVPRSRLVFLWGNAEGAADVRVMVSLNPATRELRGLSVTPKGAHELQPVPAAWKAAGRHMIGPPDLWIDDEGRAVEKDWKCGQESLPAPLDLFAGTTDQGGESGVKELTPDWAKAGISSLHTATVAVDTDNQIMTNKFGNNTTTAANYIASLFAQMNVIYERDLLVRLLVGTTFLRTTPDPYTVNDVAPYDDSLNSNKLFELTNYWSANQGGITRAIALMLSGRGGGGAAGVAWINALCNTGFGYAFSRVFTSGTTPNFGDLLVTAHEIGHNFGSPHTHCYNTLGLTNPDNCYAGEGPNGCFGGTPSCPAPATYSGIANVTGTLMSYCHLLGGCSSSLVFHPTSVNYLDDIILSHTTGGGACIIPFSPPGPTVSSATPNVGLTNANTPVTITGSNFQNGATVTFDTGAGAVAGLNVVVVSSTTLGTVAPPHATAAVRVTVTNPNTQSGFRDNTFFYAPPPATADFFTLTPCRILDTRNANGPLGGPALGANATRIFTVTGVCGIPSNPTAISANVTVVAGGSAGVFSFYPGNAFPLGTSNLNFTAGRVRANNMILMLSTNGTGTIGLQNASPGTNHVIIDVNGYFQ
jgi:metallopeptidase family M12-like protein/IPT/TIG domain-containing protein